MKAAQEIFDSKVGRHHRELAPLNYANIIEAMKEYAREACADQRQLCSDWMDLMERGKVNGNVNHFETAPEPELK